MWQLYVIVPFNKLERGAANRRLSLKHLHSDEVVTKTRIATGA